MSLGVNPRGDGSRQPRTSRVGSAEYCTKRRECVVRVSWRLCCEGKSDATSWTRPVWPLPKGLRHIPLAGRCRVKFYFLTPLTGPPFGDVCEQPGSRQHAVYPEPPPCIAGSTRSVCCCLAATATPPTSFVARIPAASQQHRSLKQA